VTIRPENFLHPEDKSALDALKKVPFFDQICSSLIKYFNEPIRHVHDMSTKIKVSEQQMPKIYGMVKEICEDMAIDIPDIYVELEREPNACTYGDQKVTISITSGLLECLNDEEIYAVLAHECGHIACHHVLYHTMGNLLLKGGAIGLENILGKNLLTGAILLPIKYAFYRWIRMSEFSADRCAALCCRESKPFVSSLMRLAGGTQNIMQEVDIKLFEQQAQAYIQGINDSNYNKVIEFWMTFQDTHPLHAVRAYELDKWCENEEFERMVDMLPKRKRPEPQKPKKKWYELWKK
jgi:Zn-dependent protease with chaperone function